MELSYEIKHVEGLTDVERVLLVNILQIMEKEESIIKEIKENADDYTRVIKLADQLRITTGYQSQYKALKEQLFEYASPSLLSKIANQEKFDRKYGDGFVIPITVLPKFSSYDNMNSSNPKAQIYKKLGGTVTV